MTTSERQAWMRGIAVFLFMVIGASSFLTGAYQTRSLLWNLASGALVVTGVYYFWQLWKNRRSTRAI